MENNLKPSVILANLILDTASLRESQYDWEASLRDLESTLIKRKAAREAKPGDRYADLYINDSKPHYYLLTLEQAAEQTCAALEADPALARIVLITLTGSWNESLDWAANIAGRTFVESPGHKDWKEKMDAIYDKYEDKEPKVLIQEGIVRNPEPVAEQFDLSQCSLLPINSGVKAKSESHHMKHAMWQMWQQGNFFKEGDKLYSMRDANDKRVLSMLVAADGTCKFVVGRENRIPTDEELQVLRPLLESMGHTLDYTGPYYGQDH